MHLSISDALVDYWWLAITDALPISDRLVMHLSISDALVD